MALRKAKNSFSGVDSIARLIIKVIGEIGEEQVGCSLLFVQLLSWVGQLKILRPDGTR